MFPLKCAPKRRKYATFIAHDRLSHIKQKPASLRAGWWGVCGEPGDKEEKLRPTKKGVAAATKKKLSGKTSLSMEGVVERTHLKVQQKWTFEHYCTILRVSVNLSPIGTKLTQSFATITDH